MDHRYRYAPAYIPVERYGQQTDKANDQLKMLPVGHQESDQSEEARGHRPEVFDDRSGERAVPRGEQFTRHHETRHNYSLTTNQIART